MKYLYPAVFSYEGNRVLAQFPDLDGCSADGADEKEAFEKAEDALNHELMSLENRSEDIPSSTAIRNLKIPAHGFFSMIAADTIAYRKKMDTRTVRKSVSIPSWLNYIAIQHNINFSNLLQNALRRELQV